MRYGQMLFGLEVEEKAKKRKLEIEKYPSTTWDEALNSSFNCISIDAHGTSLEGEIASLRREGEEIIVECKWVAIYEPFFDEDGDLDRDMMSWKPHDEIEFRFPKSVTPRKVPGTNTIMIRTFSGTVATFATVRGFASRR